MPSHSLIELLSPAKDLMCGIEAINHGADAVYIGAPKFSARSAAGNSLEDIQKLCTYGHLYGVRIYVALNTILKEEELEETERLIWKLYQVGVDALIIQDMGVTRMNLPPIPLHASTQTDNCTPEKVRFLENSGFKQVVLARELSLNEIRRISEETTVSLEAFVHGALCVSYSGKCYLSAALNGRSANRGECAQYCRLPYTMIDAEDKVIVKDKHLLSLKDLNRSDQLEALMDAGISSFKIEGRLKDVTYVKNITAYYRMKLNEIFKHRPEYHRSSAGVSSCSFEPIPEKSFNRGFTSYFLHKRTKDISSFDTPKSLGEPVGFVKEIKGNSFTVAGMTSLNNGDGLAFFNDSGKLEGFRINRVDINRVFPTDMPSIRQKTPLYRNYDQIFEKQLLKPSAERKIPVQVEFSDNAFGFTLSMADDTGARIMLTRPLVKELARKEQYENIRVQLSKLGNTLFEVTGVVVAMSNSWFVPSSLLAEMRRMGVEKLIACRKIRYNREWIKSDYVKKKAVFPEEKLTYLANVSNSKAVAFYLNNGVKQIGQAFELNPQGNVPVMFTKHCLRYSMGWCPVYQKNKSSFKEPYYLQYKDTHMRLEFDCKQCQMRILLDNEH